MKARREALYLILFKFILLSIVGFEGMIWGPIVSSPAHCFLLTFQNQAFVNTSLLVAFLLTMFGGLDSMHFGNGNDPALSDT